MTSRLALCATVAAAVLFSTVLGASAQTYEVTKLVPGSAFHGVHGLGIDKAGHLFAGSVAGAALYEVDRDSGTAKIAIPTPEGSVVSDGAKDTIYVADVFAYRTVDGATGEVSEPARMHAAGVMLEYPMSATAKGDDVILSSWFTGTVQVIDRKTGATREMMHGFKAPHDAIRLGDGSILVNELGSKSLIHASGEHGNDRTVLISGLEGPVGLVGGSKDEVYVTEALAGQLSKIESNGEKTVVPRTLKCRRASRWQPMAS